MHRGSIQPPSLGIPSFELLVANVHGAARRGASAASRAAATVAWSAAARPSHGGASDTHTLAAQDALLGVDAFKHRRVFEDVGKDHEADEATADKDLLKRRYASIATSASNVYHAHIHVILSLHQLTSVQLHQAIIRKIFFQTF